MRRAYRLFEIVLWLRRRRAITARELAEKLEVSERTIYRDVQELIGSGVPIDGEAGVGYRLRPGFQLPPLMFTTEELTALQLGANMVQAWADNDLARAAESALARIDAVLPTPRAALPLVAVDWHIPEQHRTSFAPLRRAIADRRKVRIAYESERGEQTLRTVQPLGLFYWGARWTLGAWCELRQDFRSFRTDRISALDPLPDTFSGRTVNDYLRACGVDPDRA